MHQSQEFPAAKSVTICHTWAIFFGLFFAMYHTEDTKLVSLLLQHHYSTAEDIEVDAAFQIQVAPSTGKSVSLTVNCHKLTKIMLDHLGSCKKVRQVVISQLLTHHTQAHLVVMSLAQIDPKFIFLSFSFLTLCGCHKLTKIMLDHLGLCKKV